MRPAVFVAIVFASIVLCGVALRPSDAESPDFKIIVHPENPVASVSVGLLRAVYLKHDGSWPDDSAIHPIDLSNRFPVRAVFCERVLGKSVENLRRYWNQRIFSGKGTPPPQMDSAEEAIRKVLADRAAVAYLPSTADPGDAKVIVVR
jgi:hypothetical protein